MAQGVFMSIHDNLRKIIQSLNESVLFISFDVFDTLVHRKVASPSQVFLLMGQDSFVEMHFDYAHNWEQQRKLAEDKARQLATASNRADVTLEEIYQQLPVDVSTRHKLIELELLYESDNLVVNPAMDEFILHAKKMGKKIICCSDMYLSENQIRSVALSKLKNYSCIDAIYVSNEINASKAEGSMFDFVIDDLKVQPNQVLHIGDNEHSDYQMALTKGLNALLYSPSKNYLNVLDRERSFVSDDDNQLNFPRRLAALQNPFQDDQQRFFYELGATIIGPVLFGFSHWLLDYAKQKNIKQIVTIMREGMLFRYAIQEFQKLFPQDYSAIDVKLIYASRKSLFLPFLSNDSNFNRYFHLTISDLFNMFELSMPMHLSDFGSMTIQDAMETLPDVFEDVVANMSANRSIIEQKESEQKKLFLSYLHQVGIDHPLFVDFGGGGTVLKQLNNLSNSFKPEAFALLYRDVSGVDLPNLHSFFPVNSVTYIGLQQLRRSAGVYEIMLNGFESTTVGYELNDSNIVVPKQPPLPSSFYELSLNKLLFEPLQLGIQSYFEQFKHLSKPVMNISYRNNLTNIMTRLVSWPTEAESKYLGSLPFESDFDGKTTVPFIGLNLGESHDELINFLSRINYKRTFVEWPAAMFSNIIPTLYDNLYTRYHFSTVKHDKSINSILNTLDLMKKIKNKPSLYAIIWGAGFFGEQLYSRLKTEKFIQVVMCVDIRAAVANVTLQDQHVFQPEHIFLNDLDYDLLIIASERFKLAIRNSYHDLARKYAVNAKQIVEC
jgi:FMN phosphatase YigB (HAD superfamily)